MFQVTSDREGEGGKTEIICCMGTGNKLNPSRFEITDISKTSVCPLAKVIRTELRKRRIKKVKVLYSKEVPIKPAHSEEVKGKTEHTGSREAFLLCRERQDL